MRARLVLAFVACVGAWEPAAHAQATKQGQEQGHDPPPKPQPGRVHLGSTSVTVVDEHDTVDDVITRLRKAKSPAEKEETKSASAPPPAQDKTGKGHEDGRAELRSQRTAEAERADGDRPKDERRERATASRGRGERKQRR